jgi:hypothetical protein
MHGTPSLLETRASAGTHRGERERGFSLALPEAVEDRWSTLTRAREPGRRQRERLVAWSIEGTYFENCSCEVPCPCTVSLDLGADYDRCNAVLVFQIESGEIEGVDVSGLTVAASPTHRR